VFLRVRILLHAGCLCTEGTDLKSNSPDFLYTLKFCCDRNCGEREVGVYGITTKLGISSYSHKCNLFSRCASVVSRPLFIRICLLIPSGAPYLSSIRMARDFNSFCLLCPRKFLSLIYHVMPVEKNKSF